MDCRWAEGKAERLDKRWLHWHLWEQTDPGTKAMAKETERSECIGKCSGDRVEACQWPRWEWQVKGLSMGHLEFQINNWAYTCVIHWYEDWERSKSGGGRPRPLFWPCQLKMSILFIPIKISGRKFAAPWKSQGWRQTCVVLRYYGGGWNPTECAGN